MERSKVFTGLMANADNRKFILAFGSLKTKSWVKALNDKIDELIDAEVITTETELVDDIAATMSSIKTETISICTPDPGT